MENSGLYEDFDILGSGLGTDIGLFASGIYNNLGQPSGNGISVSSISGWLGTNVGQLNISIETKYYNRSGILVPPLSPDEISVYEKMYDYKYYTQMVQNNLGASAYDWSEITEEGSTVRRVSKNEIAKTYMQLAKDSKETLKDLVATYKRNKAKPRSVTGDDDIFQISYVGLGWNSSISYPFMTTFYTYGRYPS